MQSSNTHKRLLCSGEKVLSDGAKRVLQKFYLTLRKGVGQQALDVTPVTTRLLESLIRLVEARARAEHRLIATENDALVSNFGQVAPADLADCPRRALPQDERFFPRILNRT